jgi:hypothetical protein
MVNNMDAFYKTNLQACRTQCAQHWTIYGRKCHLSLVLLASTDTYPSYDPQPSILKHPLPAKNSDRSETKRTRLSNPTHEIETIEKKILDGEYASYEDVLEDVESLKPSILDYKINGALVNGITPQSSLKAKERIVAMQEFLTKASRRHAASIKQETSEGVGKETKPNTGHDNRDAGQVLTVRTQTSTGPRQVFSGLQRSACLEAHGDDSGVTTFDIAAPIDLKRLPNGFDIVEPLPLDAHMKRKEEKQLRTLGEVFAPHRNVKPLEAPRPATAAARGDSLTFIDSADVLLTQRSDAISKADHTLSALPTGQWLRYKQDPTKVDGLFQAAYSSFAPSYDNSSAIIPQRTRAALWWRKQRDQSLLEYPEDVLLETMSANLPEDNFAEAVSNFATDDSSSDAAIGIAKPLDNVDDVLSEVSDLLQTLSSYQRIRNLEQSKSSSSTPSTPEFDTYEILKSQLSIMINTLPPFAVVKLDGDQLEELNISTNFVSTAADYPGIGEADDAELLRRRAKAAATAAERRPPAPAQTTARPTTYQPAAATNYNSQRTPAYNATPASYARPTPSYQPARPPSATPQRPAYPQAQYGSSQGYTPQPTPLQTFQRPTPNGYPNYSTPQVASYSTQQKPMTNGGRYSNIPTAPIPSPTKVPTLTPQQQMLSDRQAQVIRSAATPGMANGDTSKAGVKAE